MDLSIKIQADVAQAKQNLELLKEELRDLKQSLSNNDKAIAGLNKQLAGLNTNTKEGAKAAAALKLQLSQLGTVNNTLVQGISKVKSEIVSQTASIKTLGTDLKKAETATTGFVGGISKVYGGLRTLANLIPGIGIGGLIGLIAGPLVDAFIDLFGATKKVNEEQKKFAASLDDVRSKGISTGLELQGFVNIAKDQTQSLETRNEALLQANKIMGDHGTKLTLLNIATKAVTEEINKFTEATIQQALASKFSDRAADLVIKQRDAIKDYTKELGKSEKAEKDFVAFQKIAGPGSGMEEALIGQTVELGRQKGKLNEAAGAYRLVTRELGEMKNSLSEAQTAAATLFGQIGRKIPDPEPEVVKKIKEKIIKGLKWHKEDLSKMFFDEATVTLKVPVFAELDFKKSLRGDSFLSEGLKGILSPQDLDRATKTAQLKAMGIFKGFQDGVNIAIEGLRTPPFEALFESTSKQLEAFKVGLEDITKNMFTDIAVGIAESIGSGENLFGGFMKALGSGLKILGTYMITMSTVIKGIKTAIKSLNPYLLLFGGLALVAIGAALSKAKIPGFAGGVTNFSGGLAMVGERGPEMVRLPRGSDVIPNNRLNSMSAGGMQVFIPDVRLRGSDLVIAFSRASQTISRNG